MVVPDLKYKLKHMGVTIEQMCEKLGVPIATGKKWLYGGKISLKNERQVRRFLRGEEPGPEDIVGVKRAAVCNGCIYYARCDRTCDYYILTGERRVQKELDYARAHGELVTDTKCICRETGNKKRVKMRKISRRNNGWG